MATWLRSLTLGAAMVLAVVAVATFIPSEAAYKQAREAAFTTDQIDLGLQYALERRCFMWTLQAIELALLAGMALTGCGRWLADRFLAWTGQRRVLAALGVAAVYAIAHELLYLPVGIARFYHTKAWGMSNLELDGWLRDHAIGFGIYAVIGVVTIGGLYWLLILFPRTWWVIATVGGTVLSAAFIFLSPILINPLFNDFTPLSQTEWKDQQPRVQKLIKDAEIPVEEILVMDASRQSNHTNAYFTGFGSTRRIVLYDTLLKNHTPDEIDSVLAHEIGHWMHHHIYLGVLLGAAAGFVGFFLLDRILRLAVAHPPWQLQSVGDPASVPLVLLLVYLGSWAVMPLENAVIRLFERQADAVSLDLAGQPDAFIACEKKMAIDNKSNVAPTPWGVWIFSTHPPTVERIQMAEEWRRRRRMQD